MPADLAPLAKSQHTTFHSPPQLDTARYRTFFSLFSVRLARLANSNLNTHLLASQFLAEMRQRYKSFMRLGLCRIGGGGRRVAILKPLRDVAPPRAAARPLARQFYLSQSARAGSTDAPK